MKKVEGKGRGAGTELLMDNQELIREKMLEEEA